MGFEKLALCRIMALSAFDCIRPPATAFATYSADLAGLTFDKRIEALNNKENPNLFHFVTSPSYNKSVLTLALDASSAADADSNSVKIAE